MPAEIDIKIADINSEESVRIHPITIPKGPVLEKIRINLIDVLTEIFVFVKLIPNVSASAHL